MPFILLMVALAAGVLGIIWMSGLLDPLFDDGPADVSSAYAEALGVCARDPVMGGSTILALDKVYGQAARPDALSVDISMCAALGSIQRAQDVLQENSRLLGLD